jgi:hypothetical protein
LQVVLASLAAVCLAAALPSHPARQVALLIVFAAARLAIAFFPVDTGRPHRLLAAIAFVAICWCASIRDPRWLGNVAAAGAIGTVVVRPYKGLFERAFYAAVIAWFVVVAVRLS